MTQIGDALEAARHVIAATLIALGVLGVGASLAGQLRFPDFFTRLQGAMLAPLAGSFVLAGLAVEAWDGQIALRLGLLALLIGALAPVRAHILASGAHGAGLAPLVGRQR